MEDAKWERYAALGGFVFVVLNVIGALLPGTPPAPDDTAAEIAKFFKDNDSMIMAGQALSGFGTIGLAWWFGSLFRRMRAAEGGNPRLSVVALLGLALGGTMALTSGAISSTIALRIDEVGEGGAQIFYSMAGIVIATSAFGVVIFLSAVCALNYRASMFPAWTSYLGWLAAAGFVVGSLSSANDAAVFGFAGFISFLVWCIWILAISLFMWRGTSATS